MNISNAYNRGSVDFKEFKQHIKELMTAMGRTGIKRLAIKHQDIEIELERAEPNQQGRIAIEEPTALPVKTLPASTMPVEKKDSIGREESSDRAITSPMVGTFYAASSPDTPPLIKIGDSVASEDVVCIIEAMKVMNEVKAGIAGIVSEVLISNGDPVEFGTKLFKVR